MNNETNNAAETNETNKFEIATCGRCGGSGKYSYCQMYGDTCFGCSGKGRVFTKRGLAAKKFYENSLSKRAGDLQAGEAVRLNGYGSKFHMIEFVGNSVDGFNRFHIVTKVVDYGCDPETIVRVAASVERKQQAFAAAMEYQSSLTKAGTPRKRAAKV